MEKGGYRHFMLKEIHEQPQAVQDTFAGRVDFRWRRHRFDTRGGLDLGGRSCATHRAVVILACGTSWHAGLVGKFMIEELAGLPVEVDYGSEYRYRRPDRRSADTLARSGSRSPARPPTPWPPSGRPVSKGAGPAWPSATSVGLMITRLADGVIYTHAGPEIGVASTKAFTTQLVAIYLLALWLGHSLRGTLSLPSNAELLWPSSGASAGCSMEMAVAGELRHDRGDWRGQFFRRQRLPLPGPGQSTIPIALEGALKLKEISYIHAEGYPAGEMKHGPIALIDEDMPVVAIATGERVFEKVVGNMQEVKARDGVVIALTDRDPEELGGVADEVIQVPRVSELLQPIVNVVPLQLLSYFVGVRRGCDVDQPRNLAKSVTVE